MIYKHSINDKDSGLLALEMAHWCGKNLKNDIMMSGNGGLLGVTVEFQISDEDIELFTERWG